MVISSRVVACTSRPVAFNGHPSTRGRLTGLRNKPQQKQTCQHLAVQARSHWLGWSGFNLTTYTQFMQLRFNKLISSVALRTSFVKNATVF